MGHPRFKLIVDELCKLHDSKSADYGSGGDPLGNIREVSALGISPFLGVCVRLTDKFARLATYCRKGKLNNESVRDTLRDIVVYSIIGLILLEEEEPGSMPDPQGLTDSPYYHITLNAEEPDIDPIRGAIKKATELGDSLVYIPYNPSIR